MDEIQKNLLEQVAGLHEMPAGAYNIRANGQSVDRSTTAHIDIVTKEDKQGIDIIIKPGTKKESVRCHHCGRLRHPQQRRQRQPP